MWVLEPTSCRCCNVCMTRSFLIIKYDAGVPKALPHAWPCFVVDNLPTDSRMTSAVDSCMPYNDRFCKRNKRFRELSAYRHLEQPGKAGHAQIGEQAIAASNQRQYGAHQTAHQPMLMTDERHGVSDLILQLLALQSEHGQLCQVAQGFLWRKDPGLSVLCCWPLSRMPRHYGRFVLIGLMWLCSYSDIPSYPPFRQCLLASARHMECHEMCSCFTAPQGDG